VDSGLKFIRKAKGIKKPRYLSSCQSKDAESRKTPRLKLRRNIYGKLNISIDIPSLNLNPILENFLHND